MGHSVSIKLITQVIALTISLFKLEMSTPIFSQDFIFYFKWDLRATYGSQTYHWKQNSESVK